MTELVDVAPAGERRPRRRGHGAARILVAIGLAAFVAFWTWALFFASKEPINRFDDIAWRQRAEDICSTADAERLQLADFREMQDATPSLVRDRGESILANHLMDDVHLVHYEPGRVELRVTPDAADQRHQARALAVLVGTLAAGCLLSTPLVAQEVEGTEPNRGGTIDLSATDPAVALERLTFAVVGTAVAVTLLAVPAAMVLDVPARALLVAILGPLQALFVALLLLPALPLSAQSSDGYLFDSPAGSIGIRGGFAFAAAGGDVFELLTTEHTLERGDFHSPAMSADLAITLGERLDLVMSAGYARAERLFAPATSPPPPSASVPKA